MGTVATVVLLGMVAGFVLGGGCHAPQEFVDPGPLAGPQATPRAPDDPSRPLDRVAWTLQFDVREFDASWAWIEREVDDEAERNRALGIMSMLAVAELERYEYLEPGIEQLARAMRDFPEDARLGTWHAYMHVLGALASGDPARLERGLELAREAAQTGYFSFTIWGVILSALVVEPLDEALLDEVLDSLEQMKRRTLALQFEHDEDVTHHMPRLWDSPIAMQNLSATFALKGDALALAGDSEEAKRMYYLALHTNNAYRWPWYAEVERRYADPVGFAARLRAGQEHSIAGTFPGARGRASALARRPASPRIGNGSCTYCHSHLSTDDLGSGPNFTTGWVEVPVRVPDTVAFATPTFVAFDSPWAMLRRERPAGFELGANVPFWLPENFYPEIDEHVDKVVMALPPGRYTIAGEILAGDETFSTAYSAHLAGVLGIPWTFEVQAGRLTRVDATLVFK